MATSNCPDGEEDLTEGVHFPAANVPVPSPEGHGVAVRPLPAQFPLNSPIYNTVHVPQYPPPQGPPTYSPYADNGVQYPIHPSFAFQPPPNVTLFGASSTDQFPPWLGIASNAGGTYVQSPFVALPNNGFLQPQMKPMGSSPQYAVPTNVPFVGTVTVATHDESQQEHGSEVDQPGGKRRYHTHP